MSLSVCFGRPGWLFDSMQPQRFSEDRVGLGRVALTVEQDEVFEANLQLY